MTECKRCGATRNLDKHHVKPKGMGGRKSLDDPSNLIWLCRICHSWVHAHPKLATEAGLLVPRFGHTGGKT